MKRGEGVVLLRPGITLQEGERVESRSIDVSGFETEIATESTPAREAEAPGFEILASMIALAGGVLLGRRRYGR